jgi:hypothetical protein
MKQLPGWFCGSEEKPMNEGDDTMKKLMTLAFAAMIALTLSMPAWAQATSAPSTPTTQNKDNKQDKGAATKAPKKAAKTASKATKKAAKKADKKADTKADTKTNTTK